MHGSIRLVVAAGLVAIGCGGAIADEDGGTGSGSGGNGNASGPGSVSPSACKKACPNDPEPSAEAVQACLSGRDPSGGGCDREYVALLNCVPGKLTCGADGKTDSQASSNALVTACAAQLAAFQSCVLKGFDGGLRPPG